MDCVIRWDAIDDCQLFAAAGRYAHGIGGLMVKEWEGTTFAARLRIDPADNLLVGGQEICRYLKISSMTTLWRWMELYSLPVIKRPDGVWMTTMTAIDQWIFLACELTGDKREASRNANVRAEESIRRLQRQIDADPDDKFSTLQKQRTAGMKAARAVGLAPLGSRKNYGGGRPKDPKRPYVSSNVERNLRNGHHPLKYQAGDPDKVRSAEADSQNVPVPYHKRSPGATAPSCQEVAPPPESRTQHGPTEPENEV